jgi:1-acyl-sn-glycerol-3-phosphate acyltransferase
MNRQPFEKPPKWWSPKLSHGWIRFWKPFLRREQLRRHQLVDVQISGLQQLRSAIDQGNGILITPNHPGHSDCFPIYAAAHELNSPFYIMVAWQVFQNSNWIRQLILRHHGCFSVDREGTDMSALRQARSVLESAPHPLVIFPEGEVYHLNDRVTPFREGPVTIALLAAKKASRPVVCVPCAIKYRYVGDPTAELLGLMDRLEQALLWRPRTDLPLAERIYQFAAGLLTLKEIEYLGGPGTGPLPERIRRFTQHILDRLESCHGLKPADASVPERVKAARQAVIKRITELPEDSAERGKLYHDLDDLFMVVQAYSYPGDYVAECASIERIAETLDKFEEDVLGAKTASIRGPRTAHVSFGEPIPVVANGDRKQAGGLTRELEGRVQDLLRQI